MIPAGSGDGASTAQGQKSPAGHAAVLQLLQTIGEAYSLLSKYHCQVDPLPMNTPSIAFVARFFFALTVKVL